ncbi:hypothetical protein BJ970_007038 [Saccharopolyspora phatthalungensis]|uniref:Uncharacterized protein n=1 Tax=Saccharopolyspora phatthalungensis TaxID=664693 RepID=A0A840QJT0_9PSEU|nr:hypothetical protein [Saccharopolyspora phatthalungensis]
MDSLDRCSLLPVAHTIDDDRGSGNNGNEDQEHYA